MWLAIGLGVWVGVGIIIFIVGMVSENDLCIDFIIPSLVFGLPCVVVLAIVYLWDKRETIKSYVKRRVDMLWLTKWVAKKSLAISFWFTLGLTYTQWSGMVEEWYNAPPSLEAQKLIASLNEPEGWRLMAGSDSPKLARGVTTIVPATWRADVFVSTADCSGQFSFSDRRAINKAANICLRKLTAKAMEQPA